MLAFFTTTGFGCVFFADGAGGGGLVAVLFTVVLGRFVAAGAASFVDAGLGCDALTDTDVTSPEESMDAESEVPASSSASFRKLAGAYRGGRGDPA